jgi:hypothetical protein
LTANGNPAVLGVAIDGAAEDRGPVGLIPDSTFDRTELQYPGVTGVKDEQVARIDGQ